MKYSVSPKIRYRQKQENTKNRIKKGKMREIDELSDWISFF